MQIDAALFSHPYRWLIFVDGDNVLSGIRALADSDVVIAEATNDGFSLKQFYKIESTSAEIIHERYGKWKPESGIVDERSSSVVSRRRMDLRGRTITSSYVATNSNSRNHLTDFVDKHIDGVSKLNYIVVNTVLDRLNASKKEYFHGTWGYFNAKSKTWDGMVGDLMHHGADIGGEFSF